MPILLSCSSLFFMFIFTSVYIFLVFYEERSICCQLATTVIGQSKILFILLDLLVAEVGMKDTFQKISKILIKESQLQFEEENVCLAAQILQDVWLFSNSVTCFRNQSIA